MNIKQISNYETYGKSILDVISKLTADDYLLMRDSINNRNDLHDQKSQNYKDVISSLALHSLIYRKFCQDQKHLPLLITDYDLYFNINNIYLRMLGKLPSLNPRGDYNEKIQWLKLFDQSSLHVVCSDKLAVRSFVTEKIGPKYLPLIYAEASSVEDLLACELPPDFYLKTNHDSGTVFHVESGQNSIPEIQLARFKSALTRKYGWKNGEWPYYYIKPKVFAEQSLNLCGASPPDYKFHCSNGEVLWLQYIYDRENTPREVIVDTDGLVTDIHFDHNMIHDTKFHKDSSFFQMKELASALSENFRYLRIDMYSVKGQIYIGELTFFPLMGCYKGDGQKQLSKLLAFDTNPSKERYHRSFDLLIDPTGRLVS